MSLNITIPHTFNQTEALQRTKKLLKETQKDYQHEIKDLKESWKGNKGKFNFKIRGYDLSGTIDVQPTYVEINGELPGMLKFFKSKIEKEIREHAESALQ